jgi:GNAT superfamily N-acetyltransferase
MAVIVVEPASSVPWADIERAFTGGGDGGTCWCQWYRFANSFRTMTNPERQEQLRGELAGPLSPGLIAHVDGEAAGWCRIGPRTALPRLAHTVVVKRGSSEPTEDEAVWAVTCFVVRREHRGAGVAHALLLDAIEFARKHGARVIEAYPIDTAERPNASVNSLFTGTASLFGSAGFETIARPRPGRAVMTLTL